MGRWAHVSSVSAIRDFRPALVKFQEQARQALGEMQTRMQRTASWLEQEQGPYWQRQIRKRQEAVHEAKQALQQKQLYAQADGRSPTAVDEQRALARAQRRLEEAERKVEAVRHWRRELEREWKRQQGVLQQLDRALEQDVPNALASLEQISRELEAYTELAGPGRRGGDDAGDRPSVAREVEEDEADAKEEDER